MNDDHWGPEEQARLARARVPVTPRAGDEDRLVAVLRERGLLRARRRRGAIAALGAVAAALVLAAVWLTTPRQPPVAPAASRYVLLLYAGTDPVEAAASAARRREYAEWARGVASGGVAISGEELADESRTVGAAASPAPDPLPRGFFVVSAPDLDAAARIAATCPHLRYGGRIVIQRIAG